MVGAPALGPTMSADLYNIGSNTFTTLGPIPTRISHTATLMPDGRVLIAGGTDIVGDLLSTSFFDYRTNTFSAGPNLSAARHDEASALLPNGKLLLAGGVTGGDLLESGRSVPDGGSALS